MPNHAEQLAAELNLSVKNVQGAIDLIDQGNTIPFIARYRKEATGSMDDQVLRNLGDRLEYLRGLDKRKEEVAASITARPFFEKRGYRVIREQQVERKGILLTNYVMEKEK